MRLPKTFGKKIPKYVRFQYKELALEQLMAQNYEFLFIDLCVDSIE